MVKEQIKADRHTLQSQYYWPFIRGVKYQRSWCQEWLWGFRPVQMGKKCSHLLQKRSQQEDQVWVPGVNITSLILGLWNIRGLWDMCFCRDLMEKSRTIWTIFFPFSAGHLSSMIMLIPNLQLVHAILFFALKGQRHENTSICGNKNQSG